MRNRRKIESIVIDSKTTEGRDINNENIKDKDFIKAKKILAENNIKYSNVLLDDKFKASTTGAILLIPTTIFVDSKGNIIGDIIETAYSKEQYITILQELLKNIEAGFPNIADPLITKVEVQHSEKSYCIIDGKCNIKKENE